ncbi:MAG: hypothetical protein V3V13_08730 [Paracoccaceae bacterium]
MNLDIEQLIEDSITLYEPIVIGKDQRIQNGCKLWRQFQTAVTKCAEGVANCGRQLQEKINELATAKILSEDRTLSGVICYEPDFLPSGRKIDFVVELDSDNLYVEVKTVKPEAQDCEKTWERYQSSEQHHPNNVDLIVNKEWSGAMIYKNTFASRSKFLDYSLAFEERLEEAQELRSGRGVLVFCGTGFEWTEDNLEDFADYYRYKQHRADDPFALMEQNEVERNNVNIRRNISDFAFVKRFFSTAEVQQVHFPVRGPEIGR